MDGCTILSTVASDRSSPLLGVIVFSCSGVQAKPTSTTPAQLIKVTVRIVGEVMAVLTFRKSCTPEIFLMRHWFQMVRTYAE